MGTTRSGDKLAVSLCTERRERARERERQRDRETQRRREREKERRERDPSRRIWKTTYPVCMALQTFVMMAISHTEVLAVDPTIVTLNSKPCVAILA